MEGGKGHGLGVKVLCSTAVCRRSKWLADNQAIEKTAVSGNMKDELQEVA